MNQLATTSQPGRFDEALAHFLYARERLDNLGEAVDLAEEDFAAGSFYRAEDRLIHEPANTLADLRAKIEVMLSDPAACPPSGDLMAVFDDLRSLTDNEPSRVFRPEKWLSWFEARGGMWCCRNGEVFLLEPMGVDLSGPLFELEAVGGREAVNDLIRSREAKEPENG